jgi:hypothetical protein
MAGPSSGRRAVSHREKVTIQGVPAARLCFAAQTLDSDISRQDLGTYQEDGKE